MADRVDLKDFVSGFISEAEEHLASANRNLLAVDEALKKGVTPARQVRDLFRSLHTVKGLAAMVGVDPIVDLAHEMETVLREADRAGGRLARGSVDVMLRAVRAIEDRVRALDRGEPVAPVPADLLATLQHLHAGPAPDPSPGASGKGVTLPPDIEKKLSLAEKNHLLEALREGKKAWLVDFVPSVERSGAGISITSVREALCGVGDLVKVLPRSASRADGSRGGISFGLLVASVMSASELAAASKLDVSEVAPVALEGALPSGPDDPGQPALFEDPVGPDEPGSQAGPRRALVRVEVSRLDDALEDLSALVVTRHRLKLASANLAARGADVRELNAILAENARQLRDLRASIMSARMVPISEVLNRVPLLVRGLTRSLGKPVRLQLSLGTVEVDKAVGDRIFPAVVHLLRNALDHGLEPLEERRAKGKPDEGVLTVGCKDDGGTHLELSVADDGRGIDAAAVAAKAGMPEPKNDAELLDLIAQPGLSTRAHADATSGRGMGMDIVRRVATDLGGVLQLSTVAGRGTTFTLRVPLSITIVDAFTFQAGPQAYAVPVSSVEEIIEVDPAQVIYPPAPRGPEHGRLIHRRGEPVTLLNLGELFGIEAAKDARRALIVRRNGEAFAFGVTKMLGQQEIVVRPLEDPLVQVRGVSGATDLGDGKATLVLDLIAMSHATLQRRAGRA